MLSQEERKNLEKQQYGLVGNHSAVKICGWTKKMIRNEGGCYKLKFYGIRSNQCMQLTTSFSCPNNCTICWRDYKAPFSEDWNWGLDKPKLILEEAEKAHHKLLVGLKGYKHVNKKAYETSKEVKHVALSLTGESIMYPKINELINLLHSKKISTFLVTKAQYPELIKKLNPITQIYLSLDAPNKELLKQIDRPLFKDYWERLNKSLDYLSQKKHRTCLRITLVKDINIVEPENYSNLIKKGNPDFIEVKSYMHVGASRQRLKQSNMPIHQEILEFSKELLKYLKDYEIASEHIPSRVILLAKKSFKKNDKWFTWIDFDKFFEIKEKITSDYLTELPTEFYFGQKRSSLEKTRDQIKQEKIDETTEELDFWK